MRLCLSLLQLVLLAFLLSNCQAVTDSSPPLSPSAPPNSTPTPPVTTVIITGEADGAPPGCSPEQIASRFMALLQAWNAGDPALVPAFFGIEDGTPFQWYSMDREALFHLTDLHHYVQGRVAQHDQMHLQAIQVNGWDAGRGLVHFGPVQLLRTADDLPAGSHAVQGKGAYHCDHHRFVALSLATDVGTSTQPAVTPSLEASFPPELIYATDVVSTLNALNLTI